MFFIRAILGFFVAVIITRMFTGRIYIPYIVGLAIILVGLAYFSEYLRNLNQGKIHQWMDSILLC